MLPPDVQPALFFDRDGTLNELVHYPDSGEWESPRSPGDLRILPGAGAALRALQEGGWPLFLVSNQPSFAKGKTTLEQLEAVHAALAEHFRQAGVAFTEAYYCFHHPDSQVPGYGGTCRCRKPSPFFLEEAARRHQVALGGSWLIGDQDMDVLCARNAGCRSLLIPCSASASKRGEVEPDATAGALADLPGMLLATHSNFRHPKDRP